MEKFIVTTGKTIDLAVTAALQQLGMDRDSVSVEVLENAKSGFLGIGASPAKVKVTYEVPDEPKKPEAPMSVLSSASRSKPKERPEITSSIISRPGKKIEPEEQQPARRERRPRQERRKPQNAETPKQQEKPAEKPARPEKQERPQAPKQEKPRAPRPEKPQQPAPAAPKEYAPAPEGSMEEKIEKFLTGLLTHMNSTAVPHAYRTEEGGYRAELVGGDVGMLIGRRGETLDAIQHLVNYAVNRGSDKRMHISVDAEGYRSKREESLVHLAHKMAAKAIKYKRSMALEPMNSYERHVIHTALQDYEGVSTSSTGVEPNRRVVVNYERPAGETEEPRRGNRGERSRRPRENRENRAPRAAAPVPEKKAETAEPIPAPEYPADYTPPVKNKPQSREWC